MSDALRLHRWGALVEQGRLAVEGDRGRGKSSLRPRPEAGRFLDPLGDGGHASQISAGPSTCQQGTRWTQGAQRDGAPSGQKPFSLLSPERGPTYPLSADQAERKSLEEAFVRPGGTSSWDLRLRRMLGPHEGRSEQYQVLQGERVVKGDEVEGIIVAIRWRFPAI